MSDNATITLTVNGRRITRTAGGHLTLLRWLRDLADVTDPKYGCGEGVCGACTLLVDGVPVSSCIVLAAQVDGAVVTTAAGLLEPDGSLNPLQRAFHEQHAAQCGFCTPGMLMTATAMLADGRRRSRSQIRGELHGNLCRCTGYGPIVDAVAAAQEAAAPETAAPETAAPETAAQETAAQETAAQETAAQEAAAQEAAEREAAGR